MVSNKLLSWHSRFVLRDPARSCKISFCSKIKQKIHTNSQSDIKILSFVSESWNVIRFIQRQWKKIALFCSHFLMKIKSGDFLSYEKNTYLRRSLKESIPSIHVDSRIWDHSNSVFVLSRSYDGEAGISFCKYCKID